MAVRDLDMPREMRYGVAAHALLSDLNATSRERGVLTVGHLDGPHHLDTEESDGEGGELYPARTEYFSDAGPLGIA